MCLPDARPPNSNTQTASTTSADNASLGRSAGCAFSGRPVTESADLFAISKHRSISRSSDQSKCSARMPTDLSKPASSQFSDHRNDQHSQAVSAPRRSSIDNQNASQSSADQQLNRSDTLLADLFDRSSAYQSSTTPHQSSRHNAPMSNCSNQFMGQLNGLNEPERAKMSAERRSNCQMKRIRSEPFASVRAAAKGLISYFLILMYSLMSSLMSSSIGGRRLYEQLAAWPRWLVTKVLSFRSPFRSPFRSSFRNVANSRAEFIYLLPLKKPKLSSNLSDSNSLLTCVHSERFNDCFRAPNETKNQSDERNARRSSSKRRCSANRLRWLSQLTRNFMLFVLLTSTSAYDSAGSLNTNYNLNNINGFNGYQLLNSNARAHPSITNPAKRSGAALGGRGKPDAVIYFEDLNNEQFTRLTINPFNSDVYIGAVNRLYQLNSNLQVKHLANMGPQLDSAECPGIFCSINISISLPNLLAFLHSSNHLLTNLFFPII